MDQDLQNRLRRLGVARGVRGLKNRRRTQSQSYSRKQSDVIIEDEGRVISLEQLFPGGRHEQAADGACFIVDRVYPLTYQHGGHRLGSLLDHSPKDAALFCKDERLAHLAFRDFLFLDTETTGLAGAGTLAFMVGVAFIECGSATDVLIVRQYFLRDHADETAMLLLLSELLEQKAGLITFNGRTFDLPLLGNRYLMNRMSSRLIEVPHLDLLPPARRLWRNRFGSVALGNLEKELLKVHRTEDDVPGWLIPGLYNDYLRSGDASEMYRVFYHNQLDMLSMVTLTSETIRQFSSANSDDHPIDLFSLGKWQADLGFVSAAEMNLRLAAAGDLPLELYQKALKHLGALLKRANRRDEAVPVWQQWAATSLDDVEAHVELAKHFEWQERDLGKAKMWTARALALASRWTPRRAALVRPSLEHRMARLQRKLEP
jgi:uncharacterized protein YprB with RNaseH-like and TPR domain